MDQDKESCAICMELLKTKTCEKLPCTCKTIVHLECILQWIDRHEPRTAHCPFCRQQLIHQIVLDDVKYVNVVEFVLIDD